MVITAGGCNSGVRSLAVLARGPGFNPQWLPAFILTPLNKSHCTLFFYTRREMRMDLNQKKLVSQEYCTGFVDRRCTNSRTSYHTVCSCWQLEKGGRGGRKLILLFIVQSMHLMCKRKSFLFIVTPDWASPCELHCNHWISHFICAAK